MTLWANSACEKAREHDTPSAAAKISFKNKESNMMLRRAWNNTGATTPEQGDDSKEMGRRVGRESSEGDIEGEQSQHLATIRTSQTRIFSSRPALMRV